MEKRYILLPKENGEELHRIQAVVDMPDYNVKAGDMGGLVEGEHNLSQDGTGWIDERSKISGDSVLTDGWVVDSVIMPGGSRIECHYMYQSYISGKTIIVDMSTTIIASQLFNCLISGIGKIELSDLKNVGIRDRFLISKSMIHVLNPWTIFFREETFISECKMKIKSGEVCASLDLKDVTGDFNRFKILGKANLQFVSFTEEDVCLLVSGSKSSTISGEEHNHIVVNAEVVELIDSHITGNPTLIGNLFLTNTTVKDFAYIAIDGEMKNCTLSEMARVDAFLDGWVELSEIYLSGEDVYVPM